MHKEQPLSVCADFVSCREGIANIGERRKKRASPKIAPAWLPQNGLDDAAHPNLLYETTSSPCVHPHFPTEIFCHSLQTGQEIRILNTWIPNFNVLQRRFLSLAFTPVYDAAIDGLTHPRDKQSARRILREEYPGERGTVPSHRLAGGIGDSAFG